ncbi:MAG: tyrosine-type recombinase/integrase [Oscillospiraceae bacterium]
MTTEYLLEREVERVLSALMPQNRLILRTILHTGLRVSDVLELKTAELKPSFWVTEKKTGKRKQIGLPGPLLADIRAQAGPYWAFPGRRAGSHKTRQAVWHDVKRAAKAFRLPQNVGTHSLRKVYAVRLMRKYGDIERVRRALNHRSDSVTAIYAIADTLLLEQQRRREAAKRRRSTLNAT